LTFTNLTHLSNYFHNRAGGKKMKRIKVITGLLCGAFLLFTFSNAYGGAGPVQKSSTPNQPEIISAGEDALNPEININGINLHDGVNNPIVTLGGVSLGVIGKDAAGQIVTVELPAIDPGTYVLTLQDGPSRFAQIDLTVGAVGPQGEQGETGETGAQGPQGETGETGATGATGSTGATGPQGPQGPAGVDGVDGVDGADGVLSFPTNNTAGGTNALPSTTVTGNNNTAFGFEALKKDTGGTNNTAVGSQALTNNTYGNSNTAMGYHALRNNLGASNTAIGTSALKNNNGGGGNTASGNFALNRNTSGKENTATGAAALDHNTTGNWNTATGFGALFNNNGTSNTAVGLRALFSKTTGNDNTALGIDAGIGLTSGDNNLYLDSVGPVPAASESQTIRIGDSQTKTFVQGIRGVTPDNPDGLPVVIDSNGQLGTGAAIPGPTQILAPILLHTVPAQGTSSRVVSCPASAPKIIGGGCDVTGGNGIGLIGNHPNFPGDWQCTVRSFINSSNNVNIAAYAICIH
jgi:Collagen triple helix repeat (20 copies)